MILEIQAMLLTINQKHSKMLKTDQPFASSTHFYAYFQSYRAHVEKRITGSKVEHIIHSIAEKTKYSKEEYVENAYVDSHDSDVLPKIFINLIKENHR